MYIYRSVLFGSLGVQSVRCPDSGNELYIIGPHDRLYVPVYFNDCWFIIWPETGREILSRPVGGLFLFLPALFSDLKGIARTNWGTGLPALAYVTSEEG